MCDAELIRQADKVACATALGKDLLLFDGDKAQSNTLNMSDIRCI